MIIRCAALDAAHLNLLTTVLHVNLFHANLYKKSNKDLIGCEVHPKFLTSILPAIAFFLCASFIQVRMLLNRAHSVSKLWDEAPVILCGDFNCTPKVIASLTFGLPSFSFGVV